MKKLAIITTHPIQYNAPLFQLLTSRGNISIKVFYTWGGNVLKDKFDPGFGKKIEWDIPLKEGYDHCFVKNIAADPGSHHFKGIDNPGLIKDIQDWGADAVLVYGWAFKSHLKVLRSLHKKIPVYFRGDSTLLDQQHGFRSLLKALFLKWVYSFVDMALYVGTNNKAYFLKYGLRENRLVWGPHAIDNDRFKSTDGSIAWAKEKRRELSIPTNATIFLFAGKLEQKKDPGLLMEAFCRIDDPESYLVMVGNGPLEKELRLRYGSDKRIRFMDFQNQLIMPSVYQLADVFVLPSKGPGETWGLALNEAMAAGRPIIASDKCGGATDLAEENKNGFIFAASHTEALAKKMKYVLENRSSVKEWGDHSVKKIREWSFEKYAQAIEKLVNEKK